MGGSESSNEIIDNDSKNPEKSQLKYTVIKLLVVGGPCCGKSNLVHRFINGTFTEKYMATIGIDFRAKTIKFEGKDVVLQVWETGKQRMIRYLKIINMNNKYEYA